MEERLADRLGVSRGTVRRALIELERVGLVQTLPRRLSAVVKLTESDVRELYVVRRALELAAVEAVPLPITEEQVSVLVAELDRLAAANAAHDGQASIKADLAFHRRLVSLPAYGRLLRAWDDLADQVSLVIGAVQRTGERAQADPGEHHAIVDLLAAGDRAGAHRLVSDHLTDSCRVMMAAYRA